MRKFRRRNAKRGEMIVMALTAVLVLGALTVTGVYIKNRNDALKQDGYYIDFVPEFLFYRYETSHVGI